MGGGGVGVVVVQSGQELGQLGLGQGGPVYHLARLQDFIGPNVKGRVRVYPFLAHCKPENGAYALQHPGGSLADASRFDLPYYCRDMPCPDVGDWHRPEVGEGIGFEAGQHAGFRSRCPAGVLVVKPGQGNTLEGPFRFELGLQLVGFSFGARVLTFGQ